MGRIHLPGLFLSFVCLVLIGCRPASSQELQVKANAPRPAPSPRPTSAIAMPLVLRGGLFADTCEPNNAPYQAGCSLTNGIPLRSFIWDANDTDDYFYFNPPQGQAHVELQGIPEGRDYDLYIYTCETHPCQEVASSKQWGNADEAVTFETAGGVRHYVRVYPYSGSSNLHPYRLTAFYPYP